jgi:hypothetical protein
MAPLGFRDEPVSVRLGRCSASRAGAAPRGDTHYQKRVSAPLHDRIDIHREVLPIEYDNLTNRRLREARRGNGQKRSIASKRVMLSGPKRDTASRTLDELSDALLMRHDGRRAGSITLDGITVRRYSVPGHAGGPPLCLDPLVIRQQLLPKAHVLWRHFQ